MRNGFIKINSAIVPALICPEKIEELLTNSLVIKQIGVIFERLEARVWQLSYQGKIYQVTFYPECFDERPGLQYMSWGNPLFEGLIDEVKEVLGVAYSVFQINVIQ